MVGILLVEKGALVMVEPPREPRIARVLEVHDGVFVAIEETASNSLGGLVGHARVTKLGRRVNRAGDKAAEVSSRGCPVEAVIVVQHAYPASRLGGKPISLPERAKKCNCMVCHPSPPGTNTISISATRGRRSKDPNTQIGCVIVGPNHEIRSTGYNSFPRGIRDDVPERLVRPTKYLWIEHAERNAICNAARACTATEGCTIYVEIMPCMDCARAIVQAGIVQAVVSGERMAQYSSEYYNEHFGMVEILFKEASVTVRSV